MADSQRLKSPIRRDVLILVGLAVGAIMAISMFIALLSKRTEVREEIASETTESSTKAIRPATSEELAGTATERQRAIDERRDAFLTGISDTKVGPVGGGQARSASPPATQPPPGSLGRPPIQVVAEADAAARADLERRLNEALRQLEESRSRPQQPTIVQPVVQAPVPPQRVNTRMTVTAIRSATDDEAVRKMRRARNTEILPGTILQAHLAQDVDTRVGRTIIVEVNRTGRVKDGIIEIPPGTILFGTVGNPQPGMKYMPVEFTRMVVPGKGTVEVRGYALSGDGHLGVAARYRSNIFRAVAPSIALVAVGQELERRGVDTRAPPPNQPSPLPGVVVQTPTLAQRTFPQIEAQIRQRFGNSEPYFEAKKGERTLVLIEEIIDAEVLKK
jgi:hypothetical protein